MSFTTRTDQQLIRKGLKERILDVALFSFPTLLLSLFVGSLGWAADEPVASDPIVVPSPKIKKTDFRKSRLTRDQAEGEADIRAVTVGAGEDKAIDLDFVPSKEVAAIEIGNPLIVAVKLVTVGEKAQLVLKPLKPGDTTLTMRDDEGDIKLIIKLKVTGTNLSRSAEEIKDLLRDIEGLTVRIVGQRVVIEGEILIPGDYAKVLAVVQDKSYEPLIINMTSISTVALQFISKKIQTDVSTFAPNVKTRVVNGFIFLEGSVDNRDQASRAQQVAYLYIPDPRPGNPLELRDPGFQKFTPPRAVVQNFIVINPPPAKKLDKLVRVTVYFVELKKSYAKLFGFKWQPSFNSQDTKVTFSDGSSGNQVKGSSFTGVLQNLFPKLQSAQNAGYARILKTGNVVVRSGQRAFLTEETEFSYNLINPNGLVTAQKQGVGLRAEMLPQILGQSEDIELELKMNQQNVIGKNSPGVAPNVAKHSVETRVYIKSQESAAVGGVSTDTAGTDFNKDDPGSSGTGGDPLFSLLRSKAYTKERSQFVIFVTPQIVENASDGTEDLKRSFRVKAK